MTDADRGSVPHDVPGQDSESSGNRDLVPARISAWVAKNRLLLVAGAATGLTGSLASKGGDGHDVLDLELGGCAKQACAALFQGDWVVTHLLWDLAFIVAYTALALLLIDWLWSDKTDAFKRRTWALWLPVALAVADLAEDVLIWQLHRHPLHPNVVVALHQVSHVKWFLAVAVVLVVLWQIRHHAARPDSPFKKAIPEIRRERTLHPDTTMGLAPNEMPSEWMGLGSTGICLSGGGIRSAAFSVGAMHGLGSKVVRNARFLAAASGGAYTATGMTLHQARYPGGLPFGEGSEELRRLRAKSSFLFLSGRDGRWAIGRALATIVFNLMILYLAMFVSARPIGWAIGYIHPELHAVAQQVGEIRMPDYKSGALVTGPLTISSGVEATCDDSSEPARYWSLNPTSVGTVYYDERQSTLTKKPTHESSHPTVESGLIRTCGTTIEIIAQPKVSIPAPESGQLKVTEQPTYKVDGQSQTASVPPTPESIQSRLKVIQELEVGDKTSVTDRTDISIDDWMWIVLAVLVILAVLYFGVAWSKPLGKADATMGEGWRHALLPSLTFAFGGLFIVIPWLAQELPRFVEDIPHLLPGSDLPASSFIGSAVTWIVGVLTSGVLAKITTGSLAKGTATPGKKLTRTALKAVAYLVLVLSALVLGTSIANQAAMNGPGGLGLGGNTPSLRFGRSDLEIWLVVVGVMLVLKEWIATHLWSLQPLYRDRLAAAFLNSDSDDTRGAKRTPHAFTDPTMMHANGVWPELLVCCAANINDHEGQLPAKRWADSFVISGSHMGGPTIGYMATADYNKRLSERRRRDLTTESVVAVSGAAFSPAMGNQDFGPIGGMFAALNLRLGLWLPNPLSVRKPGKDGSWNANPGWPHLLRELFGRFSYGDPFVYTTDGGHWENLGLVELLRHGCNEVIVVSAAGDGVNFFPTFGDALALALEQTGVEIHIDISALRPRLGEDLPKEGRQLLRTKAGDTRPEPMAAKPYAVGWFTRPDTNQRGRILFVEAALTDDMPWDVHAFAEGHPIFPDHPTSNQFYNHRTFEAYRALGYYQAQQGIGSTEWTDAAEWMNTPDLDKPKFATPAEPSTPVEVKVDVSGAVTFEFDETQG
ncbi:MAG: hypothetical protein ABI862_03450 [Ilumatobacteraceae bacterium]